MLFFQVSSGLGCLYTLYKRKYLPSIFLMLLTEAFGYPTKFLLRKRDYINAQLDILERET